MGTRPKRPCRYPGCPELVAPGEGYCERHKAQAAKLDHNTRGSSRQRGYDSRWDAVRKIKLSKNPLCEECLKEGRVTRADLVHHIIPVDKDPSLILVMDNLMSVCNHCHQVIHSRGGG